MLIVPPDKTVVPFILTTTALLLVVETTVSVPPVTVTFELVLETVPPTLTDGTFGSVGAA
jgi:hypothetical protein